MSDKAAGQKPRSLEGCDENGPAAVLLLSHVSIQICSFVAPCRRPILIVTLLYQSRTWCTSARTALQISFFGTRFKSHLILLPRLLNRFRGLLCGHVSRGHI